MKRWDDGMTKKEKQAAARRRAKARAQTRSKALSRTMRRGTMFLHHNGQTYRVHKDGRVVDARGRTAGRRNMRTRKTEWLNPISRQRRRRNPSASFGQALAVTGIAAAVGGLIGFMGRSVLGPTGYGTGAAIAAGASWATGVTTLGALVVALADQPKREVGLETAGVSFGASLILGILSAVAFTGAAVANVQPVAQTPVIAPTPTV